MLLGLDEFSRWSREVRRRSSLFTLNGFILLGDGPASLIDQSSVKFLKRIHAGSDVMFPNIGRNSIPNLLLDFGDSRASELVGLGKPLQTRHLSWRKRAFTGRMWVFSPMSSDAGSLCRAGVVRGLGGSIRALMIEVPRSSCWDLVDCVANSTIVSKTRAWGSVSWLREIWEGNADSF